jgi:hypothetical protein
MILEEWESVKKVCIICGKEHTKENALQLLPGGKQWTHMDCDGRGMSIFPFGKEAGL